MPTGAFRDNVPVGVVPPECLNFSVFKGEVVGNMQEPRRTCVWGLVSPLTGKYP